MEIETDGVDGQKTLHNTEEKEEKGDGGTGEEEKETVQLVGTVLNITIQEFSNEEEPWVRANLTYR